MRYHLVLAMAMAGMAPSASAQAAADPDRAVAGSGIQVRGWQGRTDRAEQRIADVRFVAMGTGYHLTNGPHAILWHQDNVATGDYTVRARLTKTPRSTSTHEESYGVFIGGSDLNGPRQNYLYCVVFGTGFGAEEDTKALKSATWFGPYKKDDLHVWGYDTRNPDPSARNFGVALVPQGTAWDEAFQRRQAMRVNALWAASRPPSKK